MKIAKFLFAVVLAAVLVAASCSSSSSDSSNSPTSSSTTATVQPPAAVSSSAATTSTSAPVEEPQVVPFETDNGTGTVTISGGSAVAGWFADPGLSGDIFPLPLGDVDVADSQSVVEGVVSFWFFADGDSGEIPPSIYVSGGGDITDSLGTNYVVESEFLPPAPTAETTTTTSSSTSTSTSAAPTVEPETTEPPATTSTTTTATPTTTTTTVVESPVTLQVQVLNGSGVAGAAGRLTSKLAEAGYVVLPAGNAPERYATSAVYYQEGWQDRAEEILQIVELDEIEQVSAMPQQFISPDASVVVLIGRDTAPVAVRSSGPEPIIRYRLGPEDVPINVPKDRFDARAFGASLPVNVRDRPEDVARSSNLLKRAAYCFEDEIAYFEDNCLENDLPAIWNEIEQIFDRLGFTSKNVCGSVADGSFADGIVHIAEWNPATKNYSGNGIFTTDRFLEVNRQAGINVQRINPQANLDFYLRKAAQSAYDILRFQEIMQETSASHLILCAPWVTDSGGLPWAAYSVANTFAVPVREFWSQSTYHIKEISRNGNYAYVVVCHPTLGVRDIRLYWKNPGYRALTVGPIGQNGCRARFEEVPYIRDDTDLGDVREDTFTFSFGERAFSASDLQGFPRG